MSILFKKYLVTIIALFITACTTSRSTISQNADLSKYEYASVINNDTYHIPVELMEYEIQLFDAIEQSRLKLVSDMKIYELSHSLQSKLLLVKYGVNVKQEETVVTVSFIDFETGRTVVSCKGAYSSLGIAGVSADINGAIKRATEQIRKTFGASR